MSPGLPGRVEGFAVAFALAFRLIGAKWGRLLYQVLVRCSASQLAEKNAGTAFCNQRTTSPAAEELGARAL
jgi:hypothetical protein